jgi:hypothetical protein
MPSLWLDVSELCQYYQTPVTTIHEFGILDHRNGNWIEENRRDGGKMKIGLLRAAVVVGLVTLAYAPGAYACWACDLQPTSATVNGVTYYWTVGGCGTPDNNSWGSENCHVLWQNVLDGYPSAVVECDTYGDMCYYTEVNGGGGGGTGGGDPNNPGTGDQDQDGHYCPAWLITCI